MPRWGLNPLNLKPKLKVDKTGSGPQAVGLRVLCVEVRGTPGGLQRWQPATSLGLRGHPGSEGFSDQSWGHHLTEGLARLWRTQDCDVLQVIQLVRGEGRSDRNARPS